MTTIAQGIESGDIKVGDRIYVEFEIESIGNDNWIYGKIEDKFIALPFKFNYTKPIEVPASMELVAVPKIGSRWKHIFNDEEVKSVTNHSVDYEDGEAYLDEFLENYKPITKRTVSKEEAIEFFAKHGESVVIV